MLPILMRHNLNEGMLDEKESGDKSSHSTESPQD